VTGAKQYQDRHGRPTPVGRHAVGADRADQDHLQAGEPEPRPQNHQSHTEKPRPKPILDRSGQGARKPQCHHDHGGVSGERPRLTGMPAVPRCRGPRRNRSQGRSRSRSRSTATDGRKNMLTAASRRMAQASPRVARRARQPPVLSSCFTFHQARFFRLDVGHRAQCAAGLLVDGFWRMPRPRAASLSAFLRCCLLRLTLA
jgi:hypothetical protein